MAALASGILLSRLAAFGALETATALAAFCGLAVLAAWRRFRALACVCGLLAVMMAGILADLAHRPGPAPELDADHREIVILRGCVAEPPVFFADREQFTLELEQGARARVNLYGREGQPPPLLGYGQRVEIDARVRRTHNFQNPGSFDYAGYLARRGIYWTASARPGSAVRVLGERCGSPFWAEIYGLRAVALERLEQLCRGRPYDTAMLAGVLVGESSRLEKVWTEEFRRTGTYHALVISGLQVTVLAAFLLMVLRLCVWRETPALLVTVSAAWLYALVAGWQIPVLRAAAGLSLFFAGRLFYRRRRLLNLLAAVAIVFLAIDPEQMFEASFQLSFLAVAAIAAVAIPFLEATTLPLARGLRGLSDPDRDAYLTPRVAEFRIELRLLAETVALWTRAPGRWVLGALRLFLHAAFYAWELAVTSAVVQIGLALPMAVYFHRVSLSGLSANLLVVPLMTLLVPVGFLAMLTGWSAPAWVASALLDWSRRIVAWHAIWEPDWRIPAPPLWLAAAFTAALIALPAAGRMGRRAQVAALAAALALLAVIVAHPFAPQLEPGTLELTSIDVGQGDSHLLVFPEGKLVMVDGGGLHTFSKRRAARLDIGEDVVSPYLWSRSIRRLDALALSHGHEDHLGGLAALMVNFRPRELWIGAVPDTGPAAELCSRAQRGGLRVRRLRAGDRFAYGGAEVEALWPPSDYAVADEPRNDDSLVLRVRHGRRSVLLTGDLERAESRLIVEARLTPTDVIKVAHHGGRASTSEAFLERAHPAVAVISAGFENSYNLPHPEVLERLQRHRVAVFRTDLQGLVTVRTDGLRLRVDALGWP